MGDLVSGRYPDFEEEWLFDGQPLPPYRRSLNRRDIAIAAGVGIPVTTKMLVTAVPCQPGDVFGYVTFGVVTAGTQTASAFVVVYSAVPTSSAAATVLGVSATFTATAGANKIALSAPVSLSPTEYTPQGAGAAGTSLGSGPVVLGVGICLSYSAGTPTLDGSASGAAYAGLLTGQVPISIISSATIASPPTVGSSSGTGWTTTGGGSVPYVVLSRQ